MPATRQTIVRLAASLLLAHGAAAAAMVNISNINFRMNTTGHIMDAHDGSYNQWGGPGTPWYYYAMGYGDECKQGGDMCHHCGYGYSWIGVWKSDTMASGTWELVREVRAAPAPPFHPSPLCSVPIVLTVSFLLLPPSH